MVAYSFQPEFADPISAGTKRQTLRNDRKRHARERETLQLFTGLRTRNTKLLGTATCLSLQVARLDLVRGRYSLDGKEAGSEAALLAFAQADGFRSWSHLAEFWRKHHPGVDQWEGVRIFWDDTFRAAE